LLQAYKHYLISEKCSTRELIIENTTSPAWYRRKINIIKKHEKNKSEEILITL